MPRKLHQTPLLAALADARDRIALLNPGETLHIPLLPTARTEMAKRIGTTCRTLFGRGCYSVIMQEGDAARVSRLKGIEG